MTGDGTGYKIVFDTAYFNVGTNYGTGTGNYTAPVTGSYCFYAMVTFTNIGVSTTVRGLLVEVVSIFCIYNGSSSS